MLVPDLTYSQKFELWLSVIFALLAFMPLTYEGTFMFVFLFISAFSIFLVDVMFSNEKDFEFEPQNKVYWSKTAPNY